MTIGNDVVRDFKESALFRAQLRSLPNLSTGVGISNPLLYLVRLLLKELLDHAVLFSFRILSRSIIEFAALTTWLFNKRLDENAAAALPALFSYNDQSAQTKDLLDSKS